ncbi:MAG: hypothetical protein K2N11_10345 [Mucispirillum sp.]|nr:hypothetical protein [Mucispirillum sp.]
MIKKILLLLFILTAFQVYAFDVENLKGADCRKLSDAEDEGFYLAVWNTYQCDFSSSATMESIYKDVIQNIADASYEKLAEASKFVKSEFENKIKEIKNKKQDISYLKEYGIINRFMIGVQFRKNYILIKTNEGSGDKYYIYFIHKSISDSSISLTYDYDSVS